MGHMYRGTLSIKLPHFVAFKPQRVSDGPLTPLRLTKPVAYIEDRLGCHL